MDDTHKYVFLLQVEELALDTSFSSLEMSRMIALCFEHRPVRREVTAPVMSCLFSCPPPEWGGGGCRGTLFSSGLGDCILLNMLNIKERIVFLPWSGWVRFVITSHHSVLKTRVIVWRLLGAQKVAKTEFVVCFFFLFAFEGHGG